MSIDFLAIPLITKNSRYNEKSQSEHSLLATLPTTHLSGHIRGIHLTPNTTRFTSMLYSENPLQCSCQRARYVNYEELGAASLKLFPMNGHFDVAFGWLMPSTPRS